MSERTVYEKNWSETFGNEYTKRCDVQYETRVPIFMKLLGDMELDGIDILEVGCNKAHNLRAINEVLYCRVFGIDINKESLETAGGYKTNLILGQADELPWLDKSFHLVFTAGVLIHIPPEKIERVMREMYRVSKKYVMMIEYPAKEEDARNYRDIDDKDRFGVWGRPYGKMYEEFFPESKLVKTGHIRDLGDDGWGFSKDCDYFIYQK